MGKPAMDAAPSSSPSEDFSLSGETPPVPGIVKCKFTLQCGATFSAYASSFTEVDLVHSLGYNAVPERPSLPDTSIIDTDDHLATSPSSSHAADFTSSPGNAFYAGMDISSPSLSHAGDIESRSENSEMVVDMHAPMSVSALPADMDANVLSSCNIASKAEVSPCILFSLSVSPEDDLADARLGVSNPLPSGMFDVACSKHAFLFSYMNTLLPVLRKIHSQSSSISPAEKVSAVKLAADMSLAVSMGGSNAWRQALFKRVSSPFCRSLLRFPSTHSSPSKLLKTARRKINSPSSISALYKRARGSLNARSVASRKANYSRSAHGFSKSLCVLQCGYGVTKCVLHGESFQAQLRNLKPRKLISRSRRSSYLRILRSSRCMRKQRNVRVACSSENEADRPWFSAISKEQIESLGGLVPGGHNMDVPLLLEQAADYILTLQMQVEALQSLSRLVSA